MNTDIAEQALPRSSNFPNVAENRARAGVARLMWLTLGAIALGFGAVGVVLPVLPSTPFAILAAFAFARSAPSLQERLETSRTFGPVIADWRANGAIAPRYKVIALSMMAGAFCVSVVMEFPTQVLIIQAACIAAAAAFILSRPNHAA